VTWQLYNDSREAYFIEFGINPHSYRRVRRPIRKLSLMRTLRFAQGTGVYHRIWAQIYLPGGPRRTKGFVQTVQSPFYNTSGRIVSADPANLIPPGTGLQ
jgi:hypothetical protein